MVSQCTQIVVRVVSRPIHRFDAPTETKIFDFRLTLFRQSLPFCLFGIFTVKQNEVLGIEALVRIEPHFLLPKLHNVLRFALLEKVARNVRVKMLANHKFEFKIQPFLFGHGFFLNDHNFLAHLCRPHPVRFLAQMTQIGVANNFFEQIIWHVRQPRGTNAALDFFQFIFGIVQRTEEAVSGFSGAFFVVFGSFFVTDIVKPSRQFQNF